jgi:hypothetical protein
MRVVVFEPLRWRTASADVGFAQVRGFAEYVALLS